MSIFGQLKGAQEMLKGMSPDQIRDLLEKAKESKGMMEEVIREEVEKAIRARNLVSREEVERMIRESK
jgi:nitrogen regulatory protein PII-like uncharacterized protein